MEPLARSGAFEGGDSGATFPPLGRATAFPPTLPSIPILLLLCTQPMRLFWLLPGWQPTDMRGSPGPYSSSPVPYKKYTRHPLCNPRQDFIKTKWPRHETFTRFKTSSAKRRCSFRRYTFIDRIDSYSSSISYYLFIDAMIYNFHSTKQVPVLYYRSTVRHKEPCVHTT